MTQNIKISLSPKSLVTIIKTLKECGATEFKYENLHIIFSKPYNPDTEVEPAINTGISRTAEKYQPDHQEEMDDLMISNPVLYEEALNAELDGSTEQESGIR